MRAKSVSTLSDREFQEEFSGFPDQIRQCDLVEIVRLRYRLRLVKDELASLEAQVRAQVTLGLPIEPGKLSLGRYPRQIDIQPAEEEK